MVPVQVQVCEGLQQRNPVHLPIEVVQAASSSALPAFTFCCSALVNWEIECLFNFNFALLFGFIIDELTDQKCFLLFSEGFRIPLFLSAKRMMSSIFCAGSPGLLTVR